MDFREFFTQFGRVLDATLMMDKDTGRPRGFGFVTFDSEGAVENALNCKTLEILGKPVRVSFHGKFNVGLIFTSFCGSRLRSRKPNPEATFVRG
jgi:RNA recognition motif-containing protein